MISSVLFIICVLILVLGIAVSDSLPAVFYVSNSKDLSFDSLLPITVETDKTASSVFENSKSGSRVANLKLFGSVPIKDVTLKTVDDMYVYVSGEPFGIKIFTDGVMIVGITEVETTDGTKNPANESGLQKGDIILAINNSSVCSNSELSAFIRESNGNPLELTVKRDSTSFTVKLTPAKSSIDGAYKAGIWVRDSSAGIGTMTFYNPNNKLYAGLGHAVCDVDTGDALPVLTGQIVSAEISEIVKGKKGSAGELKGHFVEDKILGNLLMNNLCGVFGEYNCNPSGNEAIKVAMRQEVKTGDAKILTSASGEPKYYSCKIEKVNMKDNNSLQNLVVKVTDSELIKLTGGIVQGMSGSPIIQNGMLVGAVTHVFVNEPSMGYGIFAENMLSQTNSLSDNLMKSAS